MQPACHLTFVSCAPQVKPGVDEYGQSNRWTDVAAVYAVSG